VLRLERVPRTRRGWRLAAASGKGELLRGPRDRCFGATEIILADGRDQRLLVGIELIAQQGRQGTRSLQSDPVCDSFALGLAVLQMTTQLVQAGHPTSPRITQSRGTKVLSGRNNAADPGKGQGLNRRGGGFP